MYKYTMTIDNSKYSALFESHDSAALFFDDVERDGSELIVHDFKEISIEEILKDEDFETSYKIEIISELVLPNSHNFQRIAELERELKKFGFNF